MTLTDAMREDLRRCVEMYRRTVGTFDYPNGRAIRLRTGRALCRRGLVELGNKGSANRAARWRPTEAGQALFDTEKAP